jgi:hypothetical protein
LVGGAATPRAEAAALAAVRTRVIQPAASDARTTKSGIVGGFEDKSRSAAAARARALLARFGAAAAAGTRERCASLSFEGAGVDDEVGDRGLAVLAAAEGLKLWASALALAADDDAKTGVVEVLLSLAADAAGASDAPPLRAAAATLTQRVAAAAPRAFRDAVAALEEGSKEKLRAALGGGGGGGATGGGGAASRATREAGGGGALATPPAVAK